MAIPNGHFRKLGSASLLINCKCNQRELLTFCKTISIWPTGPSKGFRNSKWAVEIGNMSDIRLDVCWILLIIGSKWFKNCLSGVWKRLKNWRKVNRMMGSSRVAWKGLFWNVFRKYDDLRPQKLGSKRIQTVEISRSFICFVKTAIFWIYLIAQAVTIESFNQCSDDSVPILSAAPRLLAKCRVQAHANWQCPYDELRVQHRLATTPLRLQDLSRARCRSCSGHVRAWVGQDETQPGQQNWAQPSGLSSFNFSYAEKTTHCPHPAAQFPGSTPPIPGCTATPPLRHSAKEEWQAASLEVHGTCWHVVGASNMADVADRIRVQNRQNGVGKGDIRWQCFQMLSGFKSDELQVA